MSLQPCILVNKTISPNMECRAGSHNLLHQWIWRTIWSYDGHEILNISYFRLVHLISWRIFLNQTSKLAGKKIVSLNSRRYFFIQSFRKFSLKDNLELILLTSVIKYLLIFHFSKTLTIVRCALYFRKISTKLTFQRLSILETQYVVDHGSLPLDSTLWYAEVFSYKHLPHSWWLQKRQKLIIIV